MCIIECHGVCVCVCVCVCVRTYIRIDVQMLLVCNFNLSVTTEECVLHV